MESQAYAADVADEHIHMLHSAHICCGMYSILPIYVWKMAPVSSIDVWSMVTGRGCVATYSP